MISHIDGQFALDCWEDPDRDDVEATTDYSDDVEELRAHAQKLLVARRFRYMELSRWDAAGDQWVEIETLTEDDL